MENRLKRLNFVQRVFNKIDMSTLKIDDAF